MKKNGRRVLGLLLLLIMMFTLVPSPNIFALEDEEESAAAASEATLEEQMVDIANEILEDINGEDQEEPEPDTEPVTEADPAEEEALVTEEETSEEETPEGDHAENEDSEESLPEADPEEESENEPEATDEVANTVLPEDSEEDEEPKEVTESEEETVSEEEPEEDEEEEELLEETEDEEYDVPYTAEAANFEVTAVTSNKAFDVPVTLVASVIPEDDSAYKEAADALAESGKQYDGMLALDIHFEDENQIEVEPNLNYPVSVSFKVKKAVIEEVTDDTTLIVPETVEVNHITSDESGETVAKTVADFADETDGSVAVSTSNTAEGESVEQISTDFTVDGFSTFTITWTNEGEEEKATIHWGTLAGSTFEEFDSTTTVDLSASSDDLAVNIDGYYYTGGKYKATETDDGVVLNDSVIRKGENGRWLVETVTYDDEGNATVNTVQVINGSDIYVYYAEKGSGGYNPPGPPPATLESITPETEKDVTPNGDGTYTIRLDITGHATEDTKQGANVIVMLDMTYSMRQNDMNGTRIAAAKRALLTLIDALDPGYDESHPDLNLVNFTLATFGNTMSTTTVRTWTQNRAQMESAVDGLSNSPGAMGTNWQGGLSGAEAIAEAANADPELGKNPTYVIFVTDGAPNCWQGHTSSSTGNDLDPQALPYAQTAANSLTGDAILYGVFCGPAAGYNNLANLVTTAKGAETINGSDVNALESAFSKIAGHIVAGMAAGNVTVDDGIPSLSNVSANVTAGEAGGFKYYIKPAGGTEKEWVAGATGENDKGAPGATYDKTNGVTWDLGEAGTLNEGWIYSVEFTVWPSQEAYDTIADLNNGVKTMTDAQLKSAGIGKNSDGTYYLLTNTHLNTTFTDPTGHVYDVIEQDVVSEAMALPTETIGVQKIWNNFLDKRNPPTTEIKLVLTKDGKNYLEGEHAVTVSSNTNWKKDDIYISVGQIKRASDGTYEILETGHDYEIVEPETYEGDYRWELTSEVYHPMVINGVTTMLIKDENASGTEGTNYYVIGGKKYKVAGTGDNLLRAWNDRKSWLQIEKKVTGEGAPADALFEFTVTITDPNKEDIWFSAYEGDNIIKDLVTSGTAQEGDTGYTGYYYAASGSAITVKIKAGWTLRFLNLPSKTTYKIEETGFANGFAFVKAEDRQIVDTDVTQADPQKPTTGLVTEGTINVPNVEFYVDYTNKYEETSVVVTKVWDDGNNQDKIRPTDLPLTLNGLPNGTEVPNPTISKDGNNWTYTWSPLPKYVNGKEVNYTVSEDTVPDGYEVSGSPSNPNGEITNSHTPETMEVTVTKVWSDNNNQDGIRPTSVEVVLTGSDGKTYKATLDGTAAEEVPTGTAAVGYESDAWEATFVNLPKNASGTEIIYTASETETNVITKDTDGPGKYKYAVTGNAADGFKVTNTHTPEVKTVTVTKIWSDNNNQDGIRPTSVEVVLTGSDGKTYSVTLDGTAAEEVPTGTSAVGYESDAWKAKYINLPKYANGKEITYTASETTTSVITGKDGVGTYAYEVAGSEANGFTVTNTHTPEVKTATVKKVWSDGNNQDGIRPASVQVVLTGSDGKTYNVTLDGTPDTAPEGTTAGGYESAAWTATYVNLPKYAGTTTEVTYTASETTTSVITGKDGAGTYAYEVTGSEANGFTVTNTHTPEEVEIVVEKEWVDNGPKSRPESITIHLLTVTEDEDGNVIETDTGKSLKLDSTGEWKGSFTKLPKFDNGEKINYKVSEDEVEGYEVSYSDVTEVSGDSNATPASEGEAQPDTGDGTPTDPVDEAVSGDDAGDATSTEETAVTTYKVTVTNTLTTIDIEIEKTVLNLYDADEDDSNGANATFVFEITVQGKNEDKPRYHSFVGIVFDEKAGTKSILVSGIPYEKGDTVTVKEVYTAGHILTDSKGDWVIEDVSYKASFTNDFSDIPYSSGIVNRGLHEGNELVIVQEEQQEVEQFR